MRSLLPIRPVKPGPDTSAGVVPFDAPGRGKSPDNIESVVLCHIARRGTPCATTVFNFDESVVAGADPDSDGEGTSDQARTAMDGGIGGEFGGADDHVVCHGAVVEQRPQAGADGSDVLGAAWVGGVAGAYCERSGRW